MQKKTYEITLEKREVYLMRLLIESEFNVIQEHMANRYVRCYKSMFTKLEMRAAHLAHTFSKWVKLLLNLIFHRSLEQMLIK